MSHLFWPLFGLGVVALAVVFGLIHTGIEHAIDAWRLRRRARRLHAGPNLTLPPRERSSR